MVGWLGEERLASVRHVAAGPLLPIQHLLPALHFIALVRRGVLVCSSLISTVACFPVHHGASEGGLVHLLALVHLLVPHELRLLLLQLKVGYRLGAGRGVPVALAFERF